MLIAAVLFLCTAVATAAVALSMLARPRAADPVRQLLRAVAPTQLAAAAMLAAAGVVALSARPQTAVVVMVVCVLGAAGTVAAGCWQSAKVAAGSLAPRGAALNNAAGGCGGACASCTLSCH